MFEYKNKIDFDFQCWNIQILSFEMLRNLSPSIFAPAKFSVADGSDLQRSNQAAIFGYLVKSPPNSTTFVIETKLTTSANVGSSLPVIYLLPSKN